jgi:nucleoside-diphosphate-sugar epimerase
MSKILVTGVGFIGSHVVDRLLDLGHKVVVFDRHFNPTKMTEYWNGQPVELFMGDIRDRDAVSEAVGLCDGAINLAGILGTSETVDNPFPSIETNVVGGLNFLQALRQHKIPGVQITVGNHFMNNSYAITKSTTERFALMYNKEHGTKCLVMRGLNAYGERQKHKPIRKIMPNFIIRALRNEPIEVYGDGEQLMDMIYVKDLAKTLVDGVLKEVPFYDQVVDVGTGVGYSVNNIAETVNRIVGNTAGIKHLPMRMGEPDRSVVVADVGGLIRNFGIHPAFDYVSLDDGVAETVAWYRKNYDWKNL